MFETNNFHKNNFMRINGRFHVGREKYIKASIVKLVSPIRPSSSLASVNGVGIKQT